MQSLKGSSDKWTEVYRLPSFRQPNGQEGLLIVLLLFKSAQSCW
jgi:hypothetical protein